MADFEEKVTISVSGADGLARAGAEAEAAAAGVKELKDELGELGGASAGADAAGESLGHVRDEALEAAAATKAAKAEMDSYRDSAGRLRAGGKFISEDGLRDLLSAGEAAKGIDRDLSGGSSGSGLARLGRDAGDAEKGLRDVGDAAGDAEKALGNGAFLSGGVSGAIDNVGEGFGKLQALAMPALIYGIASAAGTVGPALLATGAGLGAWGVLAAPAIVKVKDAVTSVTAAQSAYQSAVQANRNDPTAANAKAQASALAALHTAYASLPAPIAASVSSIEGVEKAFSAASKPIQQQALKDIPKLADDVKGLIPTLSKLAGTGGGIVSGFLKDAGKFEKSSGFNGFISNLKSEVPGALGPLRQLGGALGSVMTELFSRKNVGAGDSLISSTAGLVKAFGPGAVNQLTQGAKILSGINHTLTDWSKPGQALNNFGKHWDQTVSLGESALNNGRKHTSQLLSANQTASKAIEDFFTPHFSSHGVSWNYSNLKQPAVPSENISAGQTEGARALLQGGTPARKGASGQQGTISVTEKVKIDASGARSELAALSHYKMQDAKIKVAVTGADTAKTAFTGISTAAQQAGTKAGAAIGTGIQAGSGAAKSAATAVAGGVKGAVAPLPGQLHATGSAAGAGMAAGISSETGAVSAAAASLAAAAESAAKVHLQISSPSKVFKKIGAQTVQGYIEGLLGGKAEVEAAIKAITGVSPFKDATITSTVKALRTELTKAAAAGKVSAPEKMALTQLLDDDNTRLMKLAKQRQTLEKQIAGAEALATSVQAAALQGADLGTIAGSDAAGQAASAAASGTGLMSTDRGSGTGPATLKAGLQAQLKAIQQFRSQIKTLKKDGLDKAGLKDLLNDGVQAGGQAASQILAGGKKGVQAIAQLDNSIGLASKKLGITGGNAAYEGASQIGGQLAAGLKDSLKAVDKEMGAIDKSLVATLMTAMGDSPKQIKAAEAKLAKELGLGGGSSGGSSKSGKVTAPHKIYVPKPTQGPFAQPGPITTAARVQPGAAGTTGGPIVITLNSTITMSGRKVAKVVQHQTLQRATSNTGSGLTLPGRAT